MQCVGIKKAAILAALIFLSEKRIVIYDFSLKQTSTLKTLA